VSQDPPFFCSYLVIEAPSAVVRRQNNRVESLRLVDSGAKNRNSLALLVSKNKYQWLRLILPNMVIKYLRALIQDGFSFRKVLVEDVKFCDRAAD
jgi:hypothetical protein